MSTHVPIAIVGAGQAGLGVSYQLSRRGIEHVLLERDIAASVWKRERWDSFTMVTPNNITWLPGAPYVGSDPDGFMDLPAWLDYVEGYLANHPLPLREGVTVDAVEPRDGAFVLRTSEGEIVAGQVVIATGPNGIPILPELAEQLPPGMVGFHSCHYKNPEQLADGAVLIVGTGQSGSQIAEELNQVGRTVYLCVGTTGRLPRRYRGRDAQWWLRQPGFPPVVRQRPGSLAHYTGKDGGRELNFHQFARDGITLLGRLTALDGATARIAPGLHARLEEEDRGYVAFLRNCDDYAARHNLEVGPPVEPAELAVRDGYDQPELTSVDLAAAGVQTIIWATGFRHGCLPVPGLAYDDAGYPRVDGGRTNVPGLFLAGFQRGGMVGSTLISGIPAESALIADQLEAGLG